MIEMKYVAVSTKYNSEICRAPTEEDCEQMAKDLNYKEGEYKVNEIPNIGSTTGFFELTETFEMQ